MGDLATAGPELLAELIADAPEALRDIIYRRGTNDTSGVKAIPDNLRFGEIDGESVKYTDMAWLVFTHQLPVTPHVDDWVILGARKFVVVRAQAEDPANILWRIITRG